MNPLRRFATAAVVALMLASVALPNAHATPITIDWVTVGDLGNASDPSSGLGAVSETFRIMSYEFTNAEYVQFLNSVDPEGTNPNSIWSPQMASDVRGGIWFSEGRDNGSKYWTKASMGNKPVNYVNWFDAARVANWLHNGAQLTPISDSSVTAQQNNGAYTLGTVIDGPTPARNQGAKVFIPTENEWYKAAFYKGGGSDAGYWSYATQSNVAPTAALADASGNGTAGQLGNFANYAFAADWNSQDGNVTTVGTNGVSSSYGTFDMSGNVSEWLTLDDPSSAGRALRGGNWNATDWLLSSIGRDSNTSIEDPAYGFRLASVPEPSTFAMALAGLACGGFSMWRRRTKRA